MKFTLYTADCSGNPKNKAYPHEMIVTSAADLKKAVRFDHVCARYAGNVRSEANFEMSDVLVLDCDNTHSDDPEEWIDAESLSAIQPQSHDTEKRQDRSPQDARLSPCWHLQGCHHAQEDETPHSERNAVLRQQRS